MKGRRGWGSCPKHAPTKHSYHLDLATQNAYAQCSVLSSPHASLLWAKHSEQSLCICMHAYVCALAVHNLAHHALAHPCSRKSRQVTPPHKSRIRALAHIPTKSHMLVHLQNTGPRPATLPPLNCTCLAFSRCVSCPVIGAVSIPCAYTLMKTASLRGCGHSKTLVSFNAG